MRKLRILLAVHPSFRPDRQAIRSDSERDVWNTLKRLGHNVQIVCLEDSLGPLLSEVDTCKPHVVFNLLEEFRGEAVFDFHLVSYLEARGIAYTGCNPRGLILSRNKFVAGGVAEALGIRVPHTQLLTKGARSGPADFPLFVKLNREHASLGIRESNRVTTPHQLRQVVTRLKRDFASEILVQEFIPGQDISLSVWGNGTVRVFQPRRLHMRGGAGVSTRRVKFSSAFQRSRQPRSRVFTSPTVPNLQTQSRRLFNALDLSGYARFDFRVTDEHETYLIDVNANPNLARAEDFALSAARDGLEYAEVVQAIIGLGMGYSPRI